MYTIKGRRENFLLLYNIIPFIKTNKGKHMAILDVIKNLKKIMQEYFDRKEEIESKLRRLKFSVDKELNTLNDKEKKLEFENKKNAIEINANLELQELKMELEEKTDEVEIKIENEAFIYIKDMLEEQASDLFNAPFYFEGKPINRIEYNVFDKVMDLFANAVRT